LFRADVLKDLSLFIDKCGSKYLVTAYYLVYASREYIEVETPAHTVRSPHDIGRPVPFELLNEPQTFLCR
jgi:hypothetical protein